MPDAGTSLTEDDDVGLVELAGWTPEGLAAMLGRAGRPLPPEPGGTARHGEALIVRLTPTLAWLIDDAGGIPSRMEGCACDLSHSRVRLILDGAKAASILAKVVALDLPAWPAGRAGATGIHGVPVLVHRAAAERFEMLVPRSFARSIREWIEDAAAELSPHPDAHAMDGIARA